MVDTIRYQQPGSKLELANQFMERMAQGLEEAKAALTKAKEEYTMYYNCQCKLAPRLHTRGQSLAGQK
jgi:hypothetical protein